MKRKNKISIEKYLLIILPITHIKLLIVETFEFVF